MRYLILGEGPHKQFLQNQVNELTCIYMYYLLAVHQTWFHSTMPPIFLSCFLRVKLAQSRCWKLWPSGLPVVVSQAGGFSEVVNSNNGYVVDMFDTNTLCEVIADWLEDYHLRLLLGNDCRQKVIAHYSWENIAARLVRLVKDEGIAV